MLPLEDKRTSSRDLLAESQSRIAGFAMCEVFGAGAFWRAVKLNGA
jgi:hypothetical protein